MPNITFDKYSLIINDERVFIKSGAFHYFRTVGFDETFDRFQKMKACGYNTVDLYFNWAYHNEVRGSYDFSGFKDVRKILSLAKKAGLFVIARPGPFLNSEVSGGGLPLWLLADKNITPRNRVGMEYKYSSEYMECVKDWYNKIIPIICEFDNVILFQIENEYATDSMENEYFNELSKIAKDLGVKCPIFHNDAYNAGLWADDVDIYATDIYPYINVNSDWKDETYCFDTMDNVEDMFRSYKAEAPIFISEMQSGWFDNRNGVGYDKIRKTLGIEHENIMLKTAVSQGVTIFNNYMGVGGTSLFNQACDEVYTSYDFAAGIDEFGEINENLYPIKSVNYLLDSFDFTQTENVEVEFLKKQYENIYAKCRIDKKNGWSWLFLRNMNDFALNVDLKNEFSTELKPYDMKILPKNVELKACMIEFSDMEIFSRLENEQKEVIFLIADKNLKLYVSQNGKRQEISGDKKDFDSVQFELNGKISEFIFISEKTANAAWKIGKKIFFNVDFAYPDGKFAISSSRDVTIFDLQKGFITKNFNVELSKDEQFLKSFRIEPCAREIDVDFDYSDWEKTGAKTDSLSCKIFDEFIWYKTELPNYIKSFKIKAVHNFWIFINGIEIFNINDKNRNQLRNEDGSFTVNLSNEILSKSKNQVTILVQNLGFDKGFNPEIDNLRGLIAFETEPQVPVNFFVNEKLPVESKTCLRSDNEYILKLSETFNVDFNEEEISPKSLEFIDFCADNATIFVNGFKIGRYLTNENNEVLQKEFYIPKIFFKPENLLELVVCMTENENKKIGGFKNFQNSIIMKIGSRNKYKICFDKE